MLTNLLQLITNKTNKASKHFNCQDFFNKQDPKNFVNQGKPSRNSIRRGQLQHDMHRV